MLRPSTNSSIADGQPTSCASPSAERLRQAFKGYDNLPKDTIKQPLRVYIYDTFNRDKLRLGLNEFQTLLNHLPIATVCSEARAQAVTFCRGLVDLMDLFYVIDPPGEASAVGDELSGPIFAQPTTIMITKGERRETNEEFSTGFNSAEQLVGVVNRVFGTCVERILFNCWFYSTSTLAVVYWPHTSEMLKRWRRREMYVSAINICVCIHINIHVARRTSWATNATIDLPFS
jgi:hypothetical protein